MLNQTQKDGLISAIDAGVRDLLNGKETTSIEFEETERKTYLKVVLEAAVGKVEVEASYDAEIVKRAAAGGRAESIFIADNIATRLHGEVLKKALA